MTDSAPRPRRRTALAALLLALTTALTGLVTLATAAPASAAIKNVTVLHNGYDGCGLLPCSAAQLDAMFARARTKAYTAKKTYERTYASVCAVRSESKHVDVYPGSSAPGYRWTLTTVCGKRADVGTKLGVEPANGGFRIVVGPADLRSIATYGGAVTGLLVAKVCGAIPDVALKDLCTLAGGTIATWLSRQAASAADRGCSAIVEVTPPRVRTYLRCP